MVNSLNFKILTSNAPGKLIAVVNASYVVVGQDGGDKGRKAVSIDNKDK